jgi:hypothetical protein
MSGVALPAPTALSVLAGTVLIALVTLVLVLCPAAGPAPPAEFPPASFRPMNVPTMASTTSALPPASSSLRRCRLLGGALLGDFLPGGLPLRLPVVHGCPVPGG